MYTKSTLFHKAQKSRTTILAIGFVKSTFLFNNYVILHKIVHFFMQYSAQIAKIDPKIAVKRVQCKLVYKEYPLTIG